MNRELALFFADFAGMAMVAVVFWPTQNLTLAVALTALVTVATCVAWSRGEERAEQGQGGEIRRSH